MDDLGHIEDRMLPDQPSTIEDRILPDQPNTCLCVLPYMPLVVRTKNLEGTCRTSASVSNFVSRHYGPFDLAVFKTENFNPSAS